MITIHATTHDLTQIRFAYRPLLEIPLSYRVLINPMFQAPYHRWVEEAAHALHGVELPYLAALVTKHGYIPDFLTPTPSAPMNDLESDLAELIATPDHVIREGIAELIAEDGTSPLRQQFLMYPHGAMRCLVEELRLYWRRTLSHYWLRMIGKLESDVLYHARQLALEGHNVLFPDLHSSVQLRQNRIQLRPVCQHLDQDVELTLRGDGLQLVPLIFRGCGRMFQVTPTWQPMLAYGARGAGLWYQKPAPPNQALELALGASRAKVLRALRTPTSNREVAYKVQMSAASASQHLVRLTKAGLVEPRRSGKWVYYHLTPRGEHLLALFDISD